MVRIVPESLPFELSEYERRHAALRRSLVDRDVDVLVVTSPANVYYLTGYVASWYPPRLPVGVIFQRDSDEVLFVDWSRHVDYVPMNALHDDLIQVDYGTAPAQLTEAMRERGLTSGNVAIEWSSPSPVPSVVREIALLLQECGARVVDGDWIVDDVRVYKSAAELDRIRRAGEIADEAFRELGERIGPGMSELGISALITALLAERGSEVPAQHALVSSGPTAWADVHAFPSRRRIERGEVVSVDASAVIDRYHVNLSRAFCVGGWNQAADDYLRAGAECLARFCEEARIGESPRDAMAKAEQQLRERVPAENIWWVGGYGFGIAFPPSWVGHTYLADDGPRPTPLDVGYVSNFETILFDRVAGFEAAAIDTIVVTEDGVAPLSTIPRRLIRA